MSARQDRPGREHKSRRGAGSPSAALAGLLLVCGLNGVGLNAAYAAKAGPQASATAASEPSSAPGLAATPDTAGEPTPRAADPPARVLRLSRMTGNVSVEPAGLEEFTAAEVNGVLTTGDRVYADPSAAAELASGGLAVRLGAGADVTVSAMTDTLAQFGVAAGSVHLRSYTLAPGTVLELDSPEAAITVLQPGDLRVDVDPALHTTTVASLSGQVQVDSPGGSQVLAPGGRIRMHGGDPSIAGAAYTEPLVPGEADSLDTFSDGRDSAQASGADAASAYVNPDTVGSEDLAANGSWDASDLGPVWYPAVAAEWRPYCFGHWRYIAPWGWTWVGAEPWAFAPFHYGRWTEIGGRWGWIPGPRIVRPVYAPAMVIFAGGLQVGAALGIGVNGGGGAGGNLGVTAWFPLGPREPFFPWYTGSLLYRNRVNVSNIANPDVAEVRGLYNQRAVALYPATPDLQRTFANRGRGTVAVSQSSFAAGEAAGDAVGRSALRLPRATLASMVPLLRPAAEPARSMLLPGTPLAVPPTLARPGLTGLRPAEAAGTGAGGALSGTVTLFHRADPPLGRYGIASGRRGTESALPGRPSGPQPAVGVRSAPSGRAPGVPAAHGAAAASAPAASSVPHR